MIGRIHGLTLSLALLALLPASSIAQAFLQVDGGVREEQFGEEESTSGVTYGAALTIVIMGEYGDYDGHTLAVTGDIRHGVGFLDYGGSADYTARIEKVSFGVGFEMRKARRPDQGETAVGEVFMFGVPLALRINFGPQERGFVQGRWIMPYWTGSAYLEGEDESLITGPVGYTSGEYSDLRLSTGYIVGRIILRGQYQRRVIEMDADDVSTDLFNQRSTVLTFGVGVVL